MALRQFSEPSLAGMVSALSGSETLCLVVGAGVSAEADLPPWWSLIRELLDRAGEERLGLDDQTTREQWISEILGGESPLGAAAIAEALAGTDLAAWIPDALYGST